MTQEPLPRIRVPMPLTQNFRPPIGISTNPVGQWISKLMVAFMPLEQLKGGERTGPIELGEALRPFTPACLVLRWGPTTLIEATYNRDPEARNPFGGCVTMENDKSIKPDHPERGWWVGRFDLIDPNGDCEELDIYFLDFFTGAFEATLARVVRHVNDIVWPQLPFDRVWRVVHTLISE